MRDELKDEAAPSPLAACGGKKGHNKKCKEEEEKKSNEFAEKKVIP